MKRVSSRLDMSRAKMLAGAAEFPVHVGQDRANGAKVALLYRWQSN